MERSLALFAIGLVFGGGIGFVVAAGNGITFDGHDHDAHRAAIGHSDDGAHGGGHGGAGGGHAHDELLSLPAGSAAPRLDLTVTPDPASGWNLHIETANFRFAPENASSDHVPGEGHAHIYVNGEKIARHYGSWFHLPAIPDGEALVEVTLNANDHRLLAIEGKPLKVSATISAR